MDLVAVSGTSWQSVNYILFGDCKDILRNGLRKLSRDNIMGEVLKLIREDIRGEVV